MNWRRLDDYLQQAAIFTHVAIVVGFYLLAALGLAGVQSLAPQWQSPYEIIIGLVGVAVLVFMLRYAWQAEQLSLPYWRWLIILLVIGFAFQLGRWVVEGGILSSKPGDDDEIYIMIAHQITGQIDGPPLFSYRPPGLPLLIAGTLRAFGTSQVWAFSLIQRMMLALAPALCFTILRRWLPAFFAILASLLFLVLPINENDPTFALTQLSYSLLGLASLAVFFKSEVSEKRSVWVWYALIALLLAYRTMLRPAGAAAAIALAIVIFIFDRNRSLWVRAGLISLLVVPTLAVVLGLQTYNQRQEGLRAMSDLGSLNIFGHFVFFDPSVLPLPDSPEKDYIARLLPEVNPDWLLDYQDWIVARYRASLTGDDGIQNFSMVANTLSMRLIRENPWAYTRWIVRKFYAGLMFPRSEGVPLLWYRPELVDPPPIPPVDYTEPKLDCVAMAIVARDIRDNICETIELERTRSRFAPALPDLPSIVTLPVHAVTISLAFRLRLLLWPFLWGFFIIPCLLWLLLREETRYPALIFGAFFAADFLPIVLLGPISTRYQLVYHPVFWLVGWIAVSSLAQTWLYGDWSSFSLRHLFKKSS